MDKSELNILLVEDNPGDAYLIKQMLWEAKTQDVIPSFTLEIAKRLEDGLSYLAANEPSTILLDLSLPDSLGLDTVHSIVNMADNVPIIVLTGLGDARLAAETIHGGAQDYLVKGQFDANGLGRAIRYAIERNLLTLNLKQKHEELEASERRRQETFDKSLDGLLMVDHKDIIRYANPAAKELLPREWQPLVGKPWPYIQKSNTISEITVDDDDGGTAVLELRVAATEWHKEPMSQIYLRDTTRQKMAELARQESDERLRSTISSMDDLVFILDEDGRFQSYSHPQHLPSTRGTPAYIIGKSYKDILPDIVIRKLAPAIDAVKTSDWVKQIEYALFIGNHNYWFSAKVSPRHNFEGEFTGSTIVIRDISALKEAEETLRRKNTQLETLRRLGLELSLELSLDELLQTILNRAVDMLDSRGGCIFLHDQSQQVLVAAETTGYSLIKAGQRQKKGEGLAGRTWLQNSPLLVEDYRNWYHRQDSASLSDKTAVVGVPIRWQNEFLGVLILLSKYDQTFHPSDIQVLDLFSNQAAVALQNAHLHAQVRNYNETLAAEVGQRTRELSVAYNKLKSLDNLKNKFMADVSHELRTPISNLKLYLTLIKRGRPEKIPDYVDVINSETNRLETLLKGIFAMSTLDAGSNKDDFTDLSLSNLIEDVLISQRPFAHKKGLAITTRYPATPAIIHGSQQQLFRAVKHIIRNAILYSDEGEITIELNHNRSRALLQITDEGQGISQEDQPFIFDRFYRGKEISQSPQPGIGLGLPISKAIIELHGGTIELVSSKGQGTEVTIQLPTSSAPSDNDREPVIEVPKNVPIRSKKDQNP